MTDTSSASSSVSSAASTASHDDADAGLVTLPGVEPDPGQRRARERRTLGPTGRGWLVFAGFLLASVLAFGLPVVTTFAHRYVGQGGSDARLYTWVLGWWPHAITNGINPFHPTVVWAPTGVNMAWVTGLPGPSLVAWPITALFGPVVSLNVLLLLSPALASWAAYLLCKEVTQRFWPSVAGGMIFGFSTYMVAQMRGHLNLVLIFPVPLAVYLTVRFVRGGISWLAYLLLLAICFVTLFSTTTEVFATFAMFGVLAFAGAYIFGPKIRPQLNRALPAILLAGLLMAAVMAPYLWYASHGVPTAPVRGLGGSSIDALGWLIPRQIMAFGGTAFLKTTQHFIANPSEDGSYLPPFLLLILVLALIRGRRDRTTWLLYGFLGIAAVLAMGGDLRVHGHVVFSGMPWGLVSKLPLIGNALPQRFTMFVWLAVAVIVARWLSEPRSDGRAWLAWMAVALSLVLVFPDVWETKMHRPASAPAFFQDDQWQKIVPKGSTILIVKQPGREFVGQDMLWQEIAHYGFRMPQGYTGPEPEEFANDPVWTSLRGGALFGVTSTALRAWLKDHNVTHVVVALPSLLQWGSLLHAATGSQPVTAGGVWVYTVT